MAEMTSLEQSSIVVGIRERPTRESLSRLRAAREGFFADPEGSDLSDVRDAIARSW